MIHGFTIFVFSCIILAIWAFISHAADGTETFSMLAWENVEVADDIGRSPSASGAAGR